jgi:phage-related protein
VFVYSYQNSIYINNTETIAIKSVEVFDMMGRLIYQNNHAEVLISLQVSAGIYYVKLISEKNGILITKVSIQP